MCQSDSCADFLGKGTVGRVPADAAKYRECLGTQRMSAEEWETIRRFPVNQAWQVRHDPLPEVLRGGWVGGWGGGIPSLLAPVSDKWIEWAYTVNLDREIFSVNNGAHFKLDQVPHIDQIDSLADRSLGDKIPLLGVVPTDAATDLVLERSSQSSETPEYQRDATVSDVSSSLRYLVH